MIIHYDSSIEISGGRLLRKEATKINQLRDLVEEGQEKQPLRLFNQDNWWKALFINGTTGPAGSPSPSTLT